MANQKIPDVRVRLSAEGVDEVVRAFQQVAAAGRKAGADGSKGLGPLNAALGDLKSLLPALGIAAAVTGLGAMVKHAIDSADAIGKLSQKTGQSTETLSTLNFVAATADVEFDQLGKALIKFNRTMGELDTGSSAAAGAVNRLFGSSKALSGLNVEERFEKVAVAIGKLPPGFQKTKAAIDLFGKSGADLIPLFNDLATLGFDKARERAAQFGVVLSSDMTNAAQRANDALKTLHLQAQGVATQFSSGLVPAIGDAATALTEATTGKQVSGLKAVGELFGGIIKGIVLGILTIGKGVGSVAAFISEAFGGAFDVIKAKISDIGLAFTGWGKAARQALSGDLAGARQTVSALQTSLDKSGAASEAAAKGRLSRLGAIYRDFIDGTKEDFGKLFQGKGGVTPPKGDPGNNDDTTKQSREAAKAALALTQQRLENELALWKKQQDLIAASQKRAYDQGLTSIQDYFAARATAITSAGAREVQLLQQERQAIVNAPLDLKGDETDDAITGKKIERRKAIEAIDAKIAQAQLDTQGQIAENDDQRFAALQQLAQKQLDVQAQIKNAQGDTFGAALDAITRQVAELQKAHLPPELIAQLTQIQRAQASLAEITRQGRAAIGALSTAQGQLQNQVAGGEIFPFEAVERYDAAVQNAIPHLRDLAAQQRAAAITPEDRQAAADFSVEVDRLAVSTDEAAKRLAEFKSAVESSLTSAVSDFFSNGIDEARGFGDALRIAALSIVDSLRQVGAQMLSTLIVQKSLKALGGLFGESQGGGEQVASAAAAGTAQATPLIGASFALTAAGGVITASAVALQAAADTLLAAQLSGSFLGFADGGVVHGPGTGTSDSVPIMASRGEFVVREAAVRQPGMLPLLASINRGMGAPALRGRTMPRFAAGGLVGAAASGGAGAGGGEIHLGIEEGIFVKRVMGALRSREGQRVTIENLGKQPKRAASALGK
jgi:hypothetical protein